ncbi:hypothetical protein J1N35_004751 [Gossypium stocksii]|uniref:RNase H type-1 domain-containing protein n=1 Tax=Gossypium stocksii TaxID=47602 RepID=A0A9D3WCS8_9ROSI|nr:hypothetical protein J1N35_004751 [Gossypium stocksii]
MDGTVKIDFGYAAAREDLRDEQGEWLFGFNKRLGKCSIFDVELWGILDGLSLLQVKQCEIVLIRTDSLEVIEVIQDPDLKSSCLAFVTTRFSVVSKIVVQGHQIQRLG